MLPLLLMTDSKDEMGEFRNTGWVKVCGWLSVISLTFLNLYNLPNTFESFGIWQKSTSDLLAWIAIVVIIMLLAWTIYDMYQGQQAARSQKVSIILGNIRMVKSQPVKINKTNILIYQ
jgi:manganese transport protein